MCYYGSSVCYLYSIYSCVAHGYYFFGTRDFFVPVTYEALCVVLRCSKGLVFVRVYGCRMLSGSA